MPELIATTVWAVSAELVMALDGRLGSPIDSYVNGSQVWLTDDGPGDVTLEWRLHPAVGYRLPRGAPHDDLFEIAVAALSAESPSNDSTTIPFGTETFALAGLWEALECFCAYGDELEPQPLAVAAEAAIGIAPTAFGLVDHDAIGNEFERTGGRISLYGLLRQQLGI